jgi:hypothetical protein
VEELLRGGKCILRDSQALVKFHKISWTDKIRFTSSVNIRNEIIWPEIG